MNLREMSFGKQEYLLEFFYKLSHYAGKANVCCLHHIRMIMTSIVNGNSDDLIK